MKQDNNNTGKMQTADFLSNLRFLLMAIWGLSLLFDITGRYDLGLPMWFACIPFSLILAFIGSKRRWNKIRFAYLLLALIIPFGFVDCVD